MPKQRLQFLLLIIVTLSLSACSLIPDLPGPFGIPGI